MKSSTRERGIDFTCPEVRAILDGRKTQTRRVVKNTNDRTVSVRWHKGEVFPGPGTYEGWVREQSGLMLLLPTRCPYGDVGDRLWVRETRWRNGGYCSTNPPNFVNEGAVPSIHMPRHLSRITLEITGVRVERVQSITEADAKAEGVPPAVEPLQMRALIDAVGAGWKHQPYTTEFRGVWEDIHGLESWAANPWVWVIQFRQLDEEGGK